VPPDVYVIRERLGNCKVCGKHDDLRFGACFDCADFVKCQPINPDVYKVWDERNPSNAWLASADGDI
jgi:hypothetical protein